MAMVVHLAVDTQVDTWVVQEEVTMRAEGIRMEAGVVTPIMAEDITAVDMAADSGIRALGMAVWAIPISELGRV